jgi:hypothetical protein
MTLTTEKITTMFALRVILTVTTGRLLTKGAGPKDNGIGDLYELLNWMTEDNLFTHQLGRAAEECKPVILELYPELVVLGSYSALTKLDKWISDFVNASEPPPGVEKGDAEDGIKMWIAEIKILFPNVQDFYELPRIKDKHVYKDALAELVEMKGKDNVLVITHGVTKP